jgi:hypothetical protein
MSDKFSNTVDRFVGPCFNMWIPLFNDEDYDGKTLLEVKSRDPAFPYSMYSLADKSAFQNCPVGSQFCAQNDIDLKDKELLLFFDVGANRYRTCKAEELERGMHGIYRGSIGDVCIFESSQLHRSGESSFPRIGISIKVISL